MRRGRPERRPAAIFDHGLFGMMVSFYEPRATNHGFFLGIRCGVPPRQTQTDNDASGSPQRVAGRLHRTAPTDTVAQRHLKLTTSPRVTLGSWKKSWLVVHCSWLVKACHYTRMGCGRISQRDALWSSPTHTATGCVFFVPCNCVHSHRLYAIS